mmetsp:Transcript_33660/g.85226  ORF Transcript_33660/g.85226 Transcript_33660/m.85226 type:complete len:218 (+) Transcript_33660:637-1290(+)
MKFLRSFKWVCSLQLPVVCSPLNPCCQETHLGDPHTTVAACTMSIGNVSPAINKQLHNQPSQRANRHRPHAMCTIKPAAPALVLVPELAQLVHHGRDALAQARDSHRQRRARGAHGRVLQAAGQVRLPPVQRRVQRAGHAALSSTRLAQGAARHQVQRVAHAHVREVVREVGRGEQDVQQRARHHERRPRQQHRQQRDAHEPNVPLGLGCLGLGLGQ